MSFTIQRGTNISHWLSQSKKRGVERKTFITRQDIQWLAELGLDHVRIPIDEEQMWDESGCLEHEAFDLLQSALDWCAEAGLRAIVDLHILRSHYFLDKSPKLYTDMAEVQRFVGLWRSLSEQLRSRPTDLVAYELLNEAVAPDPQDWNRVLGVAFNAVRTLEPERTIVLGSNTFCIPDTFDQLAVPQDDHLILTFHFYYPMLVTHYTAHWVPFGAYNGPINYPGQPIPTEALGQLGPIPEQFGGGMPSLNNPYDIDAMHAQLSKPLAVREKTGHPLYCGEFGCYLQTPQPLRVAWYRDFIQVLRDHGIAWANWSYKEDFGFRSDEGVDQEVIDILFG